MHHKYITGQMVELISAPRLSNRPSGLCRILVRLPFEGARLQYRIQSLAEQNQRVVDEDDLRPSDISRKIPAPKEDGGVFNIAVGKR